MLGVEQVRVFGAGVAEQEAGDVEAGVGVERAAGWLAGAVRGQVVVEAEVADDGVGVQDLARAEGDAAAGLERVLALDPGHVVEDLEVVLVRDQRLVAVGAQVPDVLERRAGVIADVDVVRG